MCGIAGIVNLNNLGLKQLSDMIITFIKFDIILVHKTFHS